MYTRLFTVIFFAFIAAIANSQSYQYSVNLNDTANDRLNITLITPPVSQSEINFYLPRILPGTYMNSNFGKYVHDLKAFDKNGAALPVSRKDDNGWTIKQAQTLNKITYAVEDTWDSPIDNQVYEMVGTNFEGGKNFVINTCGLFGYLDGMKKTPFEISFIKPQGFYAATGLKPVSSTNTSDVFRCVNVDELYDSPIMYSLPDTATIKVGNADVLIAVYSPHKVAHAKFIATNFEKLMKGAAAYLKGKLPVDKYAFIFYFNGEQKGFKTSGAWEHSYSSFYALEEQDEQQAIGNWIDIAAHEFFHIVTPLTISSKEVKEFNFNETVLSKHLWLYEGSTEYYANHMQVWSGITKPEEFISALETKIKYSRLYFNDSLPLAEMSRESAGKWHEQYGNIYMKGALVSACIDLYLMKLSGNQYTLRDLKHDLGILYGKDKYFLDDELYDAIAKLSYPEIKDFLVTYVDGSKPVPYEEFFGLAGIDYLKKKTVNTINLGSISINNEKDKLVLDAADVNAFGKKMGYQTGDELLSINGEKATKDNIGLLIRKFNSSAKEGDTLTVEVLRKTGKKKTPVKLSQTVFKSDRVIEHVLEINPNPTPAQLEMRKAWWGQGVCK
ncbi:MAG: peptidase M61 [Citrobacter freundii]|nr:MAG: peptidase M61 [Citrobacter freundii]